MISDKLNTDGFSDTIYGRVFLKEHPVGQTEVGDIFLNGEKSEDNWIVIDQEQGWGIHYDWSTKATKGSNNVKYVEGNFEVKRKTPEKISNKPKLLIIGHGRHGKDTVGEMLRDQYDYNFTSSSRFCGEETLWDNWGCAVYDDFEAMYTDRSNHRKLWADMISAYNVPDKTKTAATMLSRGYDMYVGMRMRDELEACIKDGVFDHIVWVDRSQHLPDEPFDSMELLATDADFVIDNNGTLEDLELAVEQFAYGLGILDPVDAYIDAAQPVNPAITGTRSDVPNRSARPKSEDIGQVVVSNDPAVVDAAYRS